VGVRFVDLSLDSALGYRQRNQAVPSGASAFAGRPSMRGRRVERGEVWWASIGERCPVVLLSGDGEPALRAMQVVAPATADEKRGVVVVSGEVAADSRVMQQVIGSAGTGIGGVGIEVEVGTREGLPYDGVVRVALPRDGQVFCTWLVTLTRESLVERAGTLSRTKLGQLANALRLAHIE